METLGRPGGERAVAMWWADWRTSFFFFLSKFRHNENVHFRLILFFHANRADDDWWLLLCIWRKEKRHSGAPRTCNLINYTTHGVVSYNCLLPLTKCVRLFFWFHRRQSAVLTWLTSLSSQWVHSLCDAAGTRNWGWGLVPFEVNVMMFMYIRVGLSKRFVVYERTNGETSIGRIFSGLGCRALHRVK
jgi:hypothetical protein